MEARVGFEPTNRGFADLSLSHLGTAPFRKFEELQRPPQHCSWPIYRCFAIVTKNCYHVQIDNPMYLRKISIINQPSHPLPRIHHLSEARISVLPEGGEFLVNSKLKADSYSCLDTSQLNLNIINCIFGTTVTKRRLGVHAFPHYEFQPSVNPEAYL